MTNPLHPAPPDQEQREQALDPNRSILVQAPAGSGKTDLLTRRFLRLLAEVDDPRQIVAITFTKAAAAEMRHRIVSELAKAAANNVAQNANASSMEFLARRAYDRSLALGWSLIDLPTQLRVSTIDSFCRELALQQPLLSGLGGGLDIAEQPDQHYRRAARRTIEKVGASGSSSDQRLQGSIETLLQWRDNNWQQLEGQLINMLAHRDRWMQDFVLDSEQDWESLRARLERPFARAAQRALAIVADLLAQIPGACDEALALARFACEQSQNGLHRELAELVEFPLGPFTTPDELEEAKAAYICLARFLLTDAGSFRKVVNVKNGFPPERKREKERIVQLNRTLAEVEGLESALAGLNNLPSVRYTEDDWNIVQACFIMLRQAAAELKVVFAEAGSVDYVEIAQLAQRVLEGPDEIPTDAAIAIAEEIHHLLVDEFQDTSRRQHKLVASIVAAWPDTTGRTVFVVGDPLQSIYFFRGADVELFPRVRNLGLDLSTGELLPFHLAPLTSNFRTAPELVRQLNQVFDEVFRDDDGGLEFSPSQPVRADGVGGGPQFEMHFEFVPQVPRASASNPSVEREKELAAQERECAMQSQLNEIVDLVRSHADMMKRAHLHGEKYRIAVLGRTRGALAPIARALREAEIPFRAVDLEPLAERPEVLDFLALGRALLNAEDRVAWLGVLRAPWCGLSLEDLYALTSGDDPKLLRAPISELIRQRAHMLSNGGKSAVKRLMAAVDYAHSLRSTVPSASIGTWLKQVWERLGGAACVDAAALTNLKLLWKCLDTLPGGEPDLLGHAISMALQNLTAQPDPAANSDRGVQLMTIHKSKGLEFEVVIVPELQAGSRPTTGQMLTWLERGLASPDELSEITEFLIAPMQPKGAERGNAKQWVDRVYRDRERQEIRRIFYVAATRAREEVHLFARPEYKTMPGGQLSLCEPSVGLLSAAWPALREEVWTRFERWKRQRLTPESISLAAQSDSNLIEMPSPSPLVPKPTRLRRLPSDYEPVASEAFGGSRPANTVGPATGALYERHAGGAHSRHLGSAVHAFFEELASLRTTLNWDAARAALATSKTRVTAQIRAAGIVPSEAQSIVDEAFELASRASVDPVAAWLLAPHPQARSEARWTAMLGGSLRTVQADRLFRAGVEPLSEGQDSWWIVDYKTAHAGHADPDQALRELRPLFAPQLELYARVLRNLYGADTRVHAGLYYPRMLQFDWWEV